MSVDMGYSAAVLADSVSPAGVRLTTLEVTFPRFILAEFNTHRMFSRNSASSRAVPVKKQLEKIREFPFVPSYWGKAQPGMAAEEVISSDDAHLAKKIWLSARDDALEAAEKLLSLGIHKQTVNRLLEPFMHHTAVVTATDWDNFYNLRDNPAAQPEMQITAITMREAMEQSTPKELDFGEWHLPYIRKEDLEEPLDIRRKFSVARTARVSFLTHGEGKIDRGADISRHDDLLRMGHMSPFEHQATPMLNVDADEYSGNLRGWIQYRKLIANEDVYSG